MKRRDFYTGTIDIIKGGIESLQRIDREIAQIRADILSGRYSQDAINEMTEKISILERKIEDKIAESLATLDKHIDIMRASLSDEMALRGSDITADAELLKYNLSEKELISIMDRYKNNPTMTQLIIKNAEERGIDLGVRFAGNEEQISILNSIGYAANVVLKNRSQSEVFDELFGEGTELSEMFNTVEPPPAVTLAYTDERIANAVRVLSDNRCLNTDIQTDIIKDFENHPAVLSILRNAAVKGHNFDAVDKIDSIIKGDNTEQ